MGNVGYCRMENTYNDLLDCHENWDLAKSIPEKKYREKILELAKKIVFHYGDD